MRGDGPASHHATHYTEVVRAAANAQGHDRASTTTVLRFDGDQIVALSGIDERFDSVQRLDIGVPGIATQVFRHDPPLPHELERAIDLVEEQVTHLRKAEVGERLLTSDDRLHAWAATAGPVVPLETVEQWFQRLASASLGQPSALDGLPRGAEAAAALLVLREFMHHLGYRSVLVV
jgi:hypothetical protein